MGAATSPNTTVPAGTESQLSLPSLQYYSPGTYDEPEAGRGRYSGLRNRFTDLISRSIRRSRRLVEIHHSSTSSPRRSVIPARVTASVNLDPTTNLMNEINGELADENSLQHLQPLIPAIPGDPQLGRAPQLSPSPMYMLANTVNE